MLVVSSLQFGGVLEDVDIICSFNYYADVTIASLTVYRFNDVPFNRIFSHDFRADSGC